MIVIHVCFDGKLLGIAKGFLTSLQPMFDGAHDTLVAQSRGDTRKHLFRLAIFSLSWFVPDLMCISFELNEKVPVACLTLIGADLNKMPVILSGPSYWHFHQTGNSHRNLPSGGGCFWFVPSPGDKGVLVLYKKIISDLVASCGNVLILGRG